MIRRSMTLAIALTAACGPGKSDETETGEPTTAATTETDPPATGTTTGTGDPTAATTDTTTTGTTDSSTTAEPTTTIGTTGDSEDFEQLGLCSPLVCDPFVHDDGEIQGHQDGPEGFLDVERCILTGLRDGTPGLYIYGVNTVVANGDSRIGANIVVHADRTVTFATFFKSNYFDEDTSSQKEGFEPAQTCTIVDAAFFDNCFANHDDWTHYTECMKIEKWWTDCVAMGPRCE